MRPLSIPNDIQQYWNTDIDVHKLAIETCKAYQKLNKKEQPDVTIIIPAYNEEKTIVQTLHSICRNETSYAVEIIVANNNSKDKTAELVQACGVTCVLEPNQGIVHARNCGLAHAKGKYIINADADTIYPKFWIEELITPLEKNMKAAITYGRYSFLPEKNTKRITYFFYESLADLSRKFNNYFKDEAVNVYGCNSAFRKEHALQVDGYNHPSDGSTEDGYLALKLRNNGFGKLLYVKKALVWTTDRRIHIDGGLWVGAFKRLKRIIGG